MNKVFLIETDNSFLHKMIMKLEASGYEVFKCLELENIVFEVHKSGADIIIIDIHSSRQPGLSAINKLTERYPGKKIIVLNDPEDVKLSIRAMQMGAFDDLYLPFDFNDLNRIIEKAGEELIKDRADEK